MDKEIRTYQEQVEYSNSQLRAEIERLREVLNKLYEACVKADVEGELSEYVSGAILDAAAKALKDGE